MKCLKRINLKFDDPKMEREFRYVKQQNIMQDFKPTIVYLILLSAVVTIPSLIYHNITNIAISAGGIIALLIIYAVKRKLINFIQTLTLLAIVLYNLTRLFLIYTGFNVMYKGNLFLGGYAIGSIQIIMVTRIPNIQYKIFAVLIAYGLRCGFIMGILDPATFEPTSVIQHFLVDLFIIYIFYSTEKIERKVIQSYCENREELMKFKELLAESLPQSITIIDYKTTTSLFANNTYMATFDAPDKEPDSPFLTTTVKTDSDINKPQLESLIVDLATIREVGTLNPPLKSIENLGSSTSLKKVIEELVKEEGLGDKTLSLSATYSHHTARRSFEVTLKKIKWNREDAIAVVFNDITYQENLMALKMSNINKDRVIATVSHELRTPLNAIIGILDMTEKSVTDHEALEYLSLCKDNANLLLNLVNSLLDLQQASSGKLRVSTAWFDIRQVLSSVIKLFQFQCNKKSIFLELNIHKNVPIQINTDCNRLKQILINLIGNSIKFTSKGGIKVEVMQHPIEQDYLQVSVVDSGIGIKDEDREKLFKMYGKLEDGHSVNKNGVGLGLTISNVLVALLSAEPNGGIKIESEYGSGSKFSFKILKDYPEVIIAEDAITMKGGNPNMRDRKLVLPLAGLKKSEGSSDKEQCEENIPEDFYEELISPIQFRSKITSYMSLRRINTMELSRPFKVNIPSLGDRHFTNADSHGEGQDELTLHPSSIHKTPRHVGFETDRVKRNKIEQSPRTVSSARRDGGNIISSVRRETATFTTIRRESGLILIVDDNPFNQLVAKNLLKGSGYSTKGALGGQEAIEILKASSKDGEMVKAILMDCQMPVMDGYQTTVYLIDMMKKNEIQTAPILGWTANNSQEDIQRCYECGMVDYLPKPISQESLLTALSKLK